MRAIVGTVAAASFPARPSDADEVPAAMRREPPRQGQNRRKAVTQTPRSTVATRRLRLRGCRTARRRRNCLHAERTQGVGPPRRHGHRLPQSPQVPCAAATRRYRPVIRVHAAPPPPTSDTRSASTSWSRERRAPPSISMPRGIPNAPVRPHLPACRAVAYRTCTQRAQQPCAATVPTPGMCPGPDMPRRCVTQPTRADHAAPHERMTKEG